MTEYNRELVDDLLGVSLYLETQGHTKAAKVVNRAMILIQTQGPRLMSWEEVAAWNRMEESERDPIFVEYCPGKGFGPPCWTIKGFGYNLNYPTNSAAGYYGKYVRCWTGRPTQEQMEEAKWE